MKFRVPSSPTQTVALAFALCASTLLSSCAGRVTMETHDLRGRHIETKVLYDGSKDGVQDNRGPATVFEEPAPSLEQLPNAVRDGHYLGAFVPENHVGISQGVIQDQDPSAFMPEAVVTYDSKNQKVTLQGAAEISGRSYVLNANFRLKKNVLEFTSISASRPSTQTGRLVEDREMGKTLTNQGKGDYQNTEVWSLTKLAAQALRMQNVYAEMPKTPGPGILLEGSNTSGKGSYSTHMTSESQQTVLTIKEGGRNNPDKVTSKTTFTGKHIPPGLTVILEDLRAEKNMSKIPTVEDLAMEQLAQLKSDSKLGLLKGLPVREAQAMMERMVVLALYDIHERTSPGAQKPAATGVFQLDGKPLVRADFFFDQQACIPCLTKQGNVSQMGVEALSNAEMMDQITGELQASFAAITKERRSSLDSKKGKLPTRENVGVEVFPKPIIPGDGVIEGKYNQPVGTTRPAPVKTPKPKGKEI